MTRLFVLTTLLVCVGSVESTRCDPGWELFKGNCYFFSQHAVSGNKARQECLSRNSRLADVLSEEETAFIADRSRGISTPYWLGLNRKPAAFYWDGDAYPLSENSFTNWRSTPREPNNNVSRACEGGWRQFQGHCYKFVQDPVHWDVAKQRCGSLSASLVDIRSSEETSFIKDNMGSSQFAWIGLARQPLRWLWNYDATEMGYENWASGEPREGSLNNCGEMVTGGEWKANECRHVQKRFVCKTREAADDCVTDEGQSFPFGPCSVTCGGGEKSRVYYCTTSRTGVRRFIRETASCGEVPC